MYHDDLRQKVLWVLRNARVHARDPQLRTARGFADGGGRAPAVHRSQVGRWESGAVEVGHELVRRYERVLGLPHGQLLATIDVFSRAVLPARAPAALHPRTDPDLAGTLELVERVLGAERLSGIDWFTLSNDLERIPYALIRPADWESLLRRVNDEVGISLELEFALRYGAAVRFVRHPHTGPVVAQLAADVLRDPSAQVYADVASVLRYTSHPAAIAVLLAQLREPINNHALRSALLALTSLVAGARLELPTTVEATRLAIAHLRDTDRPFRVRRGAANLLRAVDLPHRDRLAAGLTSDNQRFAASIILAGRARRADEVRELERRVRRSLAQLLSAAHREEPVLATVLAAAIGEANEETSGAALAVLMLSPQGRVVGLTYADELVATLRRGDVVAAHECLTVLSWLMQPEALDPLTGLACDPRIDADLAYEIASAVGNCLELRGAVRDARERRLSDRLADVVRTPGPAPDVEARIRGLAYALGMRGRRDLIARLADDLRAGRLTAATPGAGAKAAELLAWWLRLPAHIAPLG